MNNTQRSDEDSKVNEHEGEAVNQVRMQSQARKSQCIREVMLDYKLRHKR